MSMPYTHHFMDKFQCPVCGKDSHLMLQTDRFIHDDGTDNVDCWVEVMSERVTHDYVVDYTGADKIWNGKYKFGESK